MSDHVCVFVEDKQRCSYCGLRYHPSVHVRFHLPSGDVDALLPERQHQQLIDGVLRANPISSYVIIPVVTSWGGPTIDQKPRFPYRTTVPEPISPPLR